MRRLKGGKPRRFGDHRRTEARPFNAAYAMITGRYEPADRLGCELAGIAADLLCDYQALRRSKRGKAGQRRKTIGLFLGALRVVGAGHNGHKPSVDELLDRVDQAWARDKAAMKRDGDG
jgi:hypothetical protein